jgi:hypothetical protein
MEKYSKLAKRTDEDEEIIRIGNEGEASVKEDLGDLQEEQGEKKKNEAKRTGNDTDKSSEAKRAPAKPLENEDEDEGNRKYEG